MRVQRPGWCARQLRLHAAGDNAQRLRAAHVRATTVRRLRRRRLGTGWEEKKSICNKFVQNAAVTCLAWPAGRHGDVCFGLADGKVKLGALKTNKTYTLYAHPAGSPVAALAASPDGRSLASGHADGSIYVFTFPEQQVGGGGCRLCTHVALCCVASACSLHIMLLSSRVHV